MGIWKRLRRYREQDREQKEKELASELEKKDLPALWISAMLVLWLPSLLILLLLCGLTWLLMFGLR